MRRLRRPDGHVMDWRFGALAAAASHFFLEGVEKPVAGVVGEGGGFGVAENIDGLTRGVYDDAAILALHQMLFYFGSKRRVDPLVKIVRKLAENFIALRFHDASPWRK